MSKFVIGTFIYFIFCNIDLYGLLEFEFLIKLTEYKFNVVKYADASFIDILAHILFLLKTTALTPTTQ